MQARRDSRAHLGTLPKKQNPKRKTEDNRKEYFEPREALIYQLVLESDKLEEERKQLTTRQKKKLDREIKNYVNIIIKTRKTPKEEAEQENETTKYSTQEETRKRKRTEDQKPTKKHKKNHPVEA